MRPADGFPNFVKVLNNRVTAFHVGILVGNSSGVQITGGSKPLERQIDSMVARIDALAMCLQFQVSRQSSR